MRYHPTKAEKSIPRGGRRAPVKNRFLARLLLLFILLSFLSGLSLSAQARERGEVTVYFPSWNIYQDAGCRVERLPWDKIDGIHHAFWKITPTEKGYALVSADPWADTAAENPNAHFPAYAWMHKQYPQVKISLSIGGWTCCGYFSQMASTAAGRASFIASCLDTLEAYPFFSGLDLDWEYPGQARPADKGSEGNPVAGDDWTNYTLLLKELRAGLDSRFGKGKKQLTVCAAGAVALLKKQDYASLFPYVDRVQLMTYDLLGTDPTVIAHHAPVYGPLSADTAVKYLQKQGVPAGKIAIGCPLYGYGWRTEHPEKPLLGQSGAKLPQKTWKNLRSLENAPGWHTGYDEEAQAAFLWNGDPASPDYGAVYSYESQRSLKARLNYIRVHGLGGLIVWECGGDDREAGWPMLTQMCP